MNGENLQPRILYPARLLFRFNRKIKSFTDKKKLREFSATKTIFTTNDKITPLGGKQKDTRRNKKITNGKESKNNRPCLEF